VEDWPKAEKIAEELEDQGWTVEARGDQRITLAMDDHFVEVGQRDGEVTLTLDTRKGITSAPAH
jgi:hypothetical protein